MAQVFCRVEIRIETIQALDAAYAEDIARALHRRSAFAQPVELRLEPGVAEVLTCLAGMPSC